MTSSVSGKRSPAELIAPGKSRRWRRESNPCARLCRPLPHHSATPPLGLMPLHLRADDGIRTRDPHLGKVMRYQLRYIRVPRARSSPGAMQNISARWRLDTNPLFTSGIWGVQTGVRARRGTVTPGPRRPADGGPAVCAAWVRRTAPRGDATVVPMPPARWRLGANPPVRPRSTTLTSGFWYRHPTVLIFCLVRTLRIDGLVAQWESVRLTRGRSLVRYQPGPQHKTLEGPSRLCVAGVFEMRPRAAVSPPGVSSGPWQRSTATPDLRSAPSPRRGRRGARGGT